MLSRHNLWIRMIRSGSLPVRSFPRSGSFLYAPGSPHAFIHVGVLPVTGTVEAIGFIKIVAAAQRRDSEVDRWKDQCSLPLPSRFWNLAAALTEKQFCQLRD
jgi:hypothetical protein